MTDTRTATSPLAAALLPRSTKKRAKAVFAAMDAKSREHAANLVGILRHEYIPDKRIGKLEIEANVRIAPDVAPWVTEDDGGHFLSYYLRHLLGRVHGAGIPKRAAVATVALVEQHIRGAAERKRRRGLARL